MSIRHSLSAALLTLLLSWTTVQAQTVSNAGFAFPSNTPELYFQFAAESAGQFSATLFVVNVGDIVPAGYQVASISLQGQPAEVLSYTYKAPSGGWPVGIYRIVVSRDGQPIHEADFHVFAAAASMPQAPAQPAPAATPESNEESVPAAPGSLNVDG